MQRLFDLAPDLIFVFIDINRADVDNIRLVPMGGARFLINVEWSFQHMPRQQRWHKHSPALFARHLICNIARSARIELGMRLLYRTRYHRHIFHFVVFAIVGELFFRECQFKNVNRLVVSRTAFFERQ